jgi:hypothetical protein
MHLDLTDDETVALLNLLTETIEGDRYPYRRASAGCGHPGEVRASGTAAAPGGPPGKTLGEGRAGRDNLTILARPKEIPAPSVALM